MGRRTPTAAALLAASALAVATGAFGGTRAAPWGSYVGSVKGTNAFVAVVISKRNHGVLAYVCDSKRIAEWFRGTAPGAVFSLRSTAGAGLTVTVGAGRATGTFRLAGTEHAFSARLAERPAGLYRGEKTANGKHFLGGWIVFPDHRQRGAVKTATSIVASPTLGFTSPITNLAVSVPSAGTITVGFTDPIHNF